MEHVCAFWFMLCIGVIGCELPDRSENLQRTKEVNYQEDSNIESDNHQETKITITDDDSRPPVDIVNAFRRPKHGKTDTSNLLPKYMSSTYQQNTVKYTNDFNTRDDEILHYSRKSITSDLKILFSRDKVSTSSLNQFSLDTSIEPVTTDVSGVASVVKGDHLPLSADKTETTFHKKDTSSAIENIEQTENISFNLTGGDDKTTFEEYERIFILSGIKKWLEQFLHFDRFRNHLFNTSSSQRTGIPEELVNTTALPQTEVTPTPQVRVDPIIEQKMRQLNQMETSQLTPIFRNLPRAAKEGQVDGGIASLCCSMG